MGVAHYAIKPITVGVSTSVDTKNPEDCLSRMKSIVMKLFQNMKMFLLQGTLVKQPLILKNMRIYSLFGYLNYNSSIHIF